MVACRFDGCPDEASVRAQFDKGCVCYPDDREQLLCEHHWWKSTPIGDAVVVEELAS